MITQDWCYNKRKVPAGAAAPVVWIERQENNMHISYKPLCHTLLERDMRKEEAAATKQETFAIYFLVLNLLS